MTTTNLAEPVLLKVLAAAPQRALNLAYEYVRSLQEAVKSEDLLVVAREVLEICSKIIVCAVLIRSAALIVLGSFVSAMLSNIGIFPIIVESIRADLRGSDVDPEAVAKEPNVYESVERIDS